MAEIIFDLSGTAGLVSRFQGDLNDTTAKPNLRYLGNDNQIADGIFNPMKRYGYLSPANNTFATVTGSLAALLTATEYDSENDDAFLAENGPSIFQLDGLDDTSLATAVTLANSSAAISDLQVYEIDGERKLFYAYSAPAAADNHIMFTYFPSGVDSVQIGGRINPAGSAEPTLSAFDRNSGGSSNTTISTPISVPSGSNQVGVAIAFTYNAVSPSSATWNGSAMTSIGSGTGSFSGGISFGWAMYRIVAPTTGTVSVTFGSATSNRVIHAFVFDGAHQVAPVTASSTNTNTDVSNEMGITINAAYQLPFTSTFSETANHTFGSAQEEISPSSENNAGTDSSSSFSMATIRLRAGYASLPFVNSEENWLTDQASGRFIQTSVSQSPFICTADNGFAYLFNDNSVHKIDGTETGGEQGTITENVLKFPSYFTCVDAVDTRGKMYIGVQSNPQSGFSDNRSYSESTVGVYVWDRQSTIVGTRDFIPLYGVRDIKKLYIAPNGDVRAICIGDDRFTQIRSISSGSGAILKTLGLSAYPNTKDSLKIMNNMAVWLGADGVFYAHGAVISGTPEELYKIGDISGQYSGTLTSGAIFIGNSESTQSRQGIILGLSDDSTQKVRRWFPHGVGTISSVAQTGNQGNVYSQVKFLPTLSTIRHINFVGMPTATNSSDVIATIKFYFNQSQTASFSKNVTKADMNKGYLSFEINKPYVHAVQIEIEYSTSQTLGTDEFAPAYAVLEYEPTSTLK